MWLRILVLAGCYFVAGRIGLLMAIPPGIATAFWPAAGVALAGVLLWGYRVWPGVLLGSFLANIWTTLSFDGTIPSVFLPVGIAAGAALQALLGAMIVRYMIKLPNPLHREHDVAIVLALVIPLSCLLNATIGSLLLWLTATIPSGELAFTWWTWWIGDTIGGTLVTPIVLVWHTRDQPDWPRRPITILIPLVLLAGGVLVLFGYTDAREQERARGAFDAQTKSLTQAIEIRLEAALGALNGMRSFHGNRPNTADQQKFSSAARQIVVPRAPVLALTWTPRITREQRTEFEASARKDFAEGYGVRQFDEGKLIEATARGDYYPILYREPEERASLGFDVASEADRRAALEHASERAAPIATAPILASRENGENKAILVFLPIYRDGFAPDAAGQRREAVVGYVIAIVKVGRLIDLAWEAGAADGIDFSMYDATDPTQRRLAFARDSTRLDQTPPPEIPRPRMLEGLKKRTMIETAGRRWMLEFQQTPEYAATQRSLQAWWVLAVGMLLTGILGAFLLVVTGRAAHIAKLVDERTAELAQANTAMTVEINERKRAEESLRQSEERFRILVERTTEYAIFMLDPKGNIITWNQGAERIKGYRAEEIVGRHFSRFYPEEAVRERTFARGLAIARETGSFEDEGWRVRKDGSRIWVRGTITPIRDNAGNLLGFWKIVRDLTEDRSAKEELRTSEERFRALTQSINDAVVSADADGNIVYWNRSAERTFGYSAEEMLGKPLALLLSETYREAHRLDMERLRAIGESRIVGSVIELEARRKDGQHFPIELSLAVWETAQGRFFSGILRDITERKQTEAAIEESRRFVERIAEMIPSILYVQDLRDQRIIYVNFRIETILGYVAADFKRPGMDVFRQNYHPEDLARLEWLQERYQAAEDHEVIDTEFRFRHANGEWRWFHNRSTIFMREDDGTPRQVIGIAQDITERKRLEEEVLEIATLEQRRIGQELHDGTGQELTGMCMLADNLTDALRELGLGEAHQASRIAQGLRHALTKVKALSRGLIPVEVDAQGLMAALTELATRINDLHGVSCVFECAEVVAIDDNFIAMQLYRIAQEAIANALKHGNPANIRVSLEAKGDYITLRVADDGVGFGDLEKTTEGMGLRIMRYRASQIGAQFSVRSEPEHGTIIASTLFRGSHHE
jgi:PAS domain S-box-containing protein